MRSFRFTKPLSLVAAGLLGGLVIAGGANAATDSQRDAYVKSHAAIAAAEHCQGAFTRAEHQALATSIRTQVGSDIGSNELHLLEQGKNEGRHLAIQRGCSDTRTRALLEHFNSTLATALR